MRRIAGLACIFFMAAAVPGMAGATQTATQSATQSATQKIAPKLTRKVVVELFTSQGCSACPPADAYLARLAAQPDVIALALHVDYWNYIGWTDQFGSPQFTERQKAYARVEGRRMIYTPQMIVNGVERVPGANPPLVQSDIRRHLAQPEPVALTLKRTGDEVAIHASVVGATPPGPVRVQLVRYRPSDTAIITRGENAGKVLDYRNIVTEWKILGIWTGEGDLDLTAQAPGKEPLVVILQKEGPGPIVAAAEIR